MNKKVNAGDPLMLLLVFGMIVFGLVMIYSASSYTAGLQYGNAFYYVKRQIFTVIIGTVMMYMISRPDYHRILKYAWPLYGIALLMLAAVFLIGTASHGQKRWIYIGPVGFQPSEFTKFILIIFLAAMCSAAEPLMKKWKGIILMFLCVMPAAAMVMATNLSTGVIILGVSFIIIFTASRKWAPFFALTGMGIAMMGVFLKLAAYRLDRIEAWLNVETHPKGYQTRQALFAIGSGGLFGLGFGKSRQKYLYLPFQYNDYIFAVICEELGFFGAAAIVMLLSALILRGYWIALHAQDRFSTVLASGLVTLIAVQAVLNLGVVTNLLPSTGIALPFFSYGGTALAVNLGEMGIVLSISRHRGERKILEE